MHPTIDPLKNHEMSKLLSGVSMTLAGIQPSAAAATEYKRLLARVTGAMGAPAARVEAILDSLANGTPVRNDVLIAAAPQWRDLIPTVRHSYAASEDIVLERDNAPRGV